ncbi:hypothetical protein K0M31_020470 [Melipona bicolor]|uniref:Uncharacterized protein n=1 Tax=Melipona bicolor TaxID=60889 RepID=A0AA40FCG5_9HYME|nr:hypothetical protein K0M31_020470 [Melipona bicolor]
MAFERSEPRSIRGSPGNLEPMFATGGTCARFVASRRDFGRNLLRSEEDRLCSPVFFFLELTNQPSFGAGCSSSIELSSERVYFVLNTRTNVTPLSVRAPWASHSAQS